MLPCSAAATPAPPESAATEGDEDEGGEGSREAPPLAEAWVSAPCPADDRRIVGSESRSLRSLWWCRVADAGRDLLEER